MQASVSAGFRVAPERPLPAGVPSLLAVVFLSCASIAGAILVVSYGYWSMALTVYAIAVFSAFRYPAITAIITTGTLIAVEPGAFDATKPLSLVIYQGPPDLMAALPITISPAEIVIVIAGLGVLACARSERRQRRIPLLLWGIPVVVLFGFAYGLYRGGEFNLGYHEARGIIFAMAAFAVAPAAPDRFRRFAFRVFLVAAAFLAVTSLLRYAMFVKWGTLPVAAEFAFSHDSVIYMAMAVGLGMTLLLRGASGRDRVLMAALVTFSFAAIIVTGRRSGTLVLLVLMVSVFFFTFPRKPLLVSGFAVLIGVMGTVYLAAYWNIEYGAMAQPARAIRSQIDPSPRDESSDLYRETEVFNVVQTIRDNRLFGVGFGNPFGRYQPLPDLTGFWSLQFHTPHQNILWLWLKMGIVGISVILAAFALVLRRCFEMLRRQPSMDDSWQTAAIVGSALLMFLAFATVDVVFPSMRAMVVLGVLFALACGFDISPPSRQVAVQ